jgi:hypothetical protein
MPRKITEEVDLPTLLRSIREDASYKIFKKIVQTTESRLKIEEDRKRVFAIHAGRKSRAVHGKKAYNASSLMDAAACDAQARSDLVEIRMKAALQMEHLEKAMDAIQNHVITEYNEELRKYQNEAQRKALIKRVQKVAHNLVTDGQELLKLCDAFITDIDKVGYHLTNMVELAKLMSAGRVI